MCVYVGVGCVRRGWTGVKGACPLRVYVISFMYLFISIMEFRAVYQFDECSTLDALFIFYFLSDPLTVKLNCPVRDEYSILT